MIILKDKGRNIPPRKGDKMYRLYVERNGKVVADLYRDGNVDAYYKFSQHFHDAEVGDVVYWQEEESGTIIAKIMIMEGMKGAAL